MPPLSLPYPPSLSPLLPALPPPLSLSPLILPPPLTSPPSPTGASATYFSSYFGSGTTGIPVVGYMGCSGTEPQVANCSYTLSNYFPSYYCNQRTVAGVKCVGRWIAEGAELGGWAGPGGF